MPTTTIAFTPMARPLYSSQRLWLGCAQLCPLTDQATDDREATTWSELWHEGRSYEASVADDECPLLQQLQPQWLCDAARTFSTDTGLGSCNISPRALLRLPAVLLEWLARLLGAVERAGRWPRLWQLVLVVLLPKLDGGRRPINFEGMNT